MNQRQRLPSISFFSPEEQASTSSKRVQNMGQVDDQLSHDFKEFLDLKDEDYYIYFPRCEYKHGFKGTSAFNMSEPEYWGTYFRSTSRGGNCDRIAAQNQRKGYEDKITNTPPKNKETISAAKAGTIYSPWKNIKYRKIFKSGSISPKKTNKTNNTLLYDQLLEYKKSICSVVVTEFSKRIIEDKNINVYYKNDYPCVMVQVPKFHVRESKIKGETSSLYSIVVAYFTGITNYIAKSENVPIELVNRASFGHNIPSVTETGTSFRINIGIVPNIYASKVLVKALEMLRTDFLAPLLNKDFSFKLNMSEKELTDQNINIQSYNNNKARNAQVEQWASNDDIFDVLCKVGDSGNRKVSLQITRKNEYIDLLTNYVNEEINEKKDFAQPLRKILKLLDYSRGKATLDVKEKDFNPELNKFDEKESQEIKNDVYFWEIIFGIHSVFTKHNIKMLYESWCKKKMNGLYCKLEEANLEFIRNSGYQNSEDGYGSDSDTEFGLIQRKLYSKKIIVSTGMRAINLAAKLSICITGTIKSDTKYMYYETSNAIKSVSNDVKLEYLKSMECIQKQIRYIDLTHCAYEGPDNKVPDLSAKSNEVVIVLDYTSATTRRINEAIKLIKEVPVLLLVSSGLKNEQIGADMNPYGTIRIITQTKNMLNKLYSTLKYLEVKEALPKELHNIRKAYKDAGAVVTSAKIFNIVYRYSPKSNKAENRNFDETCDSVFNEDTENNLTEIHYQSRNEINSWSMDKKILLGSSKVKYLVQKYNINFSQLIDKYDEDHEFTNRVIGDINEQNIHVFAYDLNYVFNEYRLNQDTYGEERLDKANVSALDIMKDRLT